MTSWCRALVLPVFVFATSVAAQSTPTTQATPPASASADKPADAAAEQSYNLRLRNIEERVNDLKEKVFQSKARLIQLQEVVLHGAISGAKAVIVHKNEMGGSFRLSRLQYALDGAPIFNRVANGNELQDLGEIEVFNGSLAPGNHQLSLYLEYTGNGYGVFSYLKDYTFKVKSSQMLIAEEGKLTYVRVVGFEKGNITTELKDRPAVRYEIDTGKAIGEEKKDAKAPASAPAPTTPPSAGGKTP
jgi:hypothetical protein